MLIYYRHLCSPSNPVTSLQFGDDLPKAVKDISDTNRLSLPKTAVPLALEEAVNHAPVGMVRGNMMVLVTATSSQKNYQSPLHFRRKQEGKKKSD